MYNANCTLQDPDIQKFMAACQLHSLQDHSKSTIPINTSTQGHHINFLPGINFLQVFLCKSNFLNFIDIPLSNLTALFAGFDEQAPF